MIEWMYFPNNSKPPEHLVELVNVFCMNEEKITSDSKQYVSDEVLQILQNDLHKIHYIVEKSKKAADKIRIPVLFGNQGKEVLSFEVDSFQPQTKTVLEVEAGRGFTNYQFLKDFFESCLMYDVKFFAVAIRRTYRNHKDFESVCSFFHALYASNRLKLPLNGILGVFVNA